MNHANDNLPLAAQGAGNGQTADNNGLTFISMFSGIEAASVAFGPLGWRAICFAEIDKKASALLAYRYPDTPNVGDMSKHDWSQYRGKVDIVCGGPPCQAFSVAGMRRGMEDDRGNLSLVYMKALHAIEPRNAIVENVPGWLSMPDNAFGCFLAGLVGADDAIPPPADKRGKPKKWPNAGMVAGPSGRAAWGILDAQHFGLAQRRKRVIVVADFGNGADPVEVLFERLGLPGYSPARREAGEGVAAYSASSLESYRDADVSGPDRAAGGDNGGGSENLVHVPTLARCVATREGSSQDYETTTMVACVTGDITHTLKAEGSDASEDGTGRGTPIIAFTAKDYGADAGSLSPTLRAGGHRDSHQNGGVGPAIAFNYKMGAKAHGIGDSEEQAPTLGTNNNTAVTVALRGREGGGTAELGGEVATALRASSGGGDEPHVLAFDTYNQAASNITHTLRNPNGTFGDALPAAFYGSAVRRLTPRECERLQGFPDDYTRIPVRRYPAKKITKNWPEDMWENINGEWWLMTADGPRYKQLGNSWAVPKFRWLGERIAKCMPAAQPMRQAA